MAERGVSDALGFVLVFALIVASVGLVYATGVSTLGDVRNFEQVTNAERAFEVLADNVEDVTVQGAPSRATEVKLADATLHVGEPVVVNVTGERYGNPADNFTFEFEVRPIVYEADSGGRVVYVNGALLREEEDGVAMRRPPTIMLSTERTNIPIVQTRSSDGQGVSGKTTVLVRTSRARSTLLTSRTAGTYNVTLNVTSPTADRADAWERYLQTEQDVDSCVRDVDDGQVSCRIVGTDRVYVTVTRIDVTFE